VTAIIIGYLLGLLLGLCFGFAIVYWIDRR
jgi:hypothetical protein